MAERAEAGERKMWPPGRSRLYANDLAIAFDLSEVELCFGQASGPEGMTEPHSWVVTTPVHLAGFGRAISRSIASYQERYGRIPGDGGSGTTPDGSIPEPGQ
jgi:hypothetical protein